MVPENDQSLPINSPENVTFTCNVSDFNSLERQAIWEVEQRQIQGGINSVRTAFENIGIFIEARGVGVTDLIVTRMARMQYQDSGLMVRCTAFTLVEPPITELGDVLFVRTYGECFQIVHGCFCNAWMFLGRPEIPGNLRLVPQKPTVLVWSRPTNIPENVVVNYTVTINSSTSARSGGGVLSDETQFSIQVLEMQLADAEECEGFLFHVVASVALADDSVAAIVMDTVPLCK